MATRNRRGASELCIVVGRWPLDLVCARHVARDRRCTNDFPLIERAWGLMPSQASANQAPVDCLVVGGGPAGLTAAIYLARFLRHVVVADAGGSRARWIPTSHNHAGFPGGVTGPALLARMREQASFYGAVVRDVKIDHVERAGEGFAGLAGDERIEARTVLLATGVTNHRPALLDDATHDAAVAAGLLRYCPVCDGFEVQDRRVAVLGSSAHGVAEAMFLRAYSEDVTLLPEDFSECDEALRAQLADAGIALVEPAVTGFSFDGTELAVELADGSRLNFDTLYPALGTHANSRIARELGITLVGNNCVPGDDHMETSLRGVWTAGDVAPGLDQISVAMGHAAVAATAIHNRLPKVPRRTSVNRR